MFTDVPASVTGAVVEMELSVVPLVKFEPKILISSPRATLPEAGARGAAPVMPEICGACAAATPVAARTEMTARNTRFNTVSHRF
jgi:hypothetical protein